LSQRLKEFIDMAVTIVNRDVNLSEFKQKYSPGENRSLLFLVRGAKDEYGFVFESDRIKATSGIEDPTVMVSTDEDTFWKIILNKTTIDYAVATRKLRIVGEYFLRDFVILRNMFYELRKVLKL